MIMNEHRISSVQDSKCLGKGDESVEFGSKEIYELKESSRDISVVKERDEFENHKVVDELPLDSSDGTMDSPKKEDQNRLSHDSRDLGKAADSLSFDAYSHDEQQRSLEHQHLVSVEEDVHYNGNEARDCGSLCNNSSGLFQIETNTLADKNVPDRDAPELEVCYKEIDHHVVKDICIAEGRPLLEGSEDDKFDNVLSQLRNDDYNCKAKEECNVQEMPHSDKNDDSRSNFVSAEKFTDTSEKENSAVDRKLAFEELSTQNLVISLDGEENAKQQADQIAHVEVLPQSSDVKLVDTESSGEVTPCGNNTYNFNVATSNNDSKEQLVNSGDVCEQKNPIMDSLSNSSAGNVTGKPVVIEHHSEHNDSKLDNHSADDQVESHGSTSGSSTSEDAETVETGFPRHEPWISNHIPAMARLLHDEGETSFSAASLINYSEPVPFSGSLSHRSDASTTSTRSFAFPVLQNEWNSSPVRMAKADRRHLRKHKCWRSGLFCCKF